MRTVGSQNVPSEGHAPNEPSGAESYHVCKEHRAEAFQSMNEMRLNGSLCDVTLIAEDQRIQAHKIVLASASHYFQAMFTSKLPQTNYGSGIKWKQNVAKKDSELVHFCRRNAGEEFLGGTHARDGPLCSATFDRVHLHLTSCHRRTQCSGTYDAYFLFRLVDLFSFNLLVHW